MDSSLPNGTYLDRSKLKAFADDKIDITKISKFVLISVENIVGKGKNAGYQHFLLFPECFPGYQKSGLCDKDLIICLTFYQRTKF